MSKVAFIGVGYMGYGMVKNLLKKHNVFIFLCILLSMYGCNNKNKKIVVENKVLIETIKNKEFDDQIYKDQKVALKKDFETNLKTNDFWLSSII